MRSRFSRRSVAAFAALLTSPVLLAAQSGGSVTGTITSAESHSALSGARASIESQARASIASQAGKFTLRDVPAGHYEVLFTALGFTPVRKSVDVVAGKATTLDVTLEPGSLLLS